MPEEEVFYDESDDVDSRRQKANDTRSNVHQTETMEEEAESDDEDAMEVSTTKNEDLFTPESSKEVVASSNSENAVEVVPATSEANDTTSNVDESTIAANAASEDQNAMEVTTANDKYEDSLMPESSSEEVASSNIGNAIEEISTVTTEVAAEENVAASQPSEGCENDTQVGSPGEDG